MFMLLKCQSSVLWLLFFYKYIDLLHFTVDTQVKYLEQINITNSYIPDLKSDLFNNLNE